MNFPRCANEDFEPELAVSQKMSGGWLGGWVGWVGWMVGLLGLLGDGVVR